jgi:crossover junction endodeoxyribonuclease RusA
VNTFEFVVEGPAVSLRAKDKSARRYQRWIQLVRVAAQTAWPAEQLPATGPVEVEIRNYYTDVPPDVDNIIKPILDALETVAYLDDRQVVQVTSGKRALGEGPPMSDPSPRLAAALVSWSEVVHVAVRWQS